MNQNNIIEFPFGQELQRCKPTSKQAQWDNAPSIQAKNQIDPKFRWVTQEGESIAPAKMNTFHLFNSLKMIWNHQVPPEFRFVPFKPYHLHIGRARRRECVTNLFLELMNRNNRTKVMDETLNLMAQYILQSQGKHLPEGQKKLPSKLF